MTRIADHVIAPLFLQRHSQRAMSGAPLPRAELMRLFEAARWAPSSGNQQPWRFVLAERDTPSFDAVFSVLAPFNQEWCARAAALVVVCTDTVRVAATGEKAVRRLAAFDAGAAWMSLALQGSAMGLVVRGMEGFDHVRARDVLAAPEGIDVLAVVAVGLPGDPGLLAEKHRAGEQPNAREPAETRVLFGRFG
jgi:nitroreductase